MYKVIKIEGEQVFIGKESGEFVPVSMSSFGAAPQVGDMVEIFQNGEDIIVSKINPIHQFTGKEPMVQKVRSKKVAGWLALLVNPAYHFYVGRHGIGAVRLLTGFIFADAPELLIVLVAVDIIIAILVFTSKSGSYWHQDAQGRELKD